MEEQDASWWVMGLYETHWIDSLCLSRKQRQIMQQPLSVW